MPQHLQDMEITRVSLVDKGANGRRLAVLKRQEGSMTKPASSAMTGALAAGIAKGRTGQAETGILAAIRKVLSPSRKVAKSAAANVSQATWALTTVLGLITSESADLDEDGADPDAADDQADVANLKAIAQGLTTYIASTAQEVGSADDLEDIAEEAAAYAAYCAGESYGVWKSARPIEKAGRKISAARLSELESASDKLLAVIADAKADSGTKEDDEEDDVEKADITKAIGEAMAAALEPVTKRLELLEASKVEKTGEGDEPVTLEGIAEAVGKVADRLEKLESAGAVGKRTSIAGQDGGEVKKRAQFAGLF
jgi:hypothetical protein